MEMEMAMTTAPLLPALAHPRWDEGGSCGGVLLRAFLQVEDGDRRKLQWVLYCCGVVFAAFACGRRWRRNDGGTQLMHDGGRISGELQVRGNGDAVVQNVGARCGSGVGSEKMVLQNRGGRR
ncbi:hypothetical protein DEO72_LG2g1764 [Vigna unguiculata]|uniref:Uncharacterized protein n=1 Tax=Vigna unguiculata TaxID=3917 RepID=A0A4D6KUP4_VIGUN|nr:hypothetical protein DEO72_LG2g1764 [Vigna unguiculata]